MAMLPKGKYLLTRGPAALLIDQIDGTAAVNVDEVEVASTDLADNFRCRYEELGLTTSDLHTKDLLRGVSSD